VQTGFGNYQNNGSCEGELRRAQFPVMPVAKGVTQHLKKIWYNGEKTMVGFIKL